MKRLAHLRAVRSASRARQSRSMEIETDGLAAMRNRDGVASFASSKEPTDTQRAKTTPCTVERRKSGRRLVAPATRLKDRAI